MNLPIFTGSALLAMCITAYAAPPATFFGDDLAIVGQPYTLKLPAGQPCQVNWGDGTIEAVTGPQAQHLYNAPDRVSISVKRGENLAPGYAAKVAASRPTLFVRALAKNGAILPRVLSVPTDSFSLECRIQAANFGADMEIFASQSAAPGACRFGLKNGQIFFEIVGSGSFAAPLQRPLAAGWHHLAVTYDRAPLFARSNQVQFWIDGRPAGSGTIPKDGAGAVVCDSARIGTADFTGKIESLAVYNRWLFPLAIVRHAQLLAGEKTLAVTVARPGAQEESVDAPKIERTVDVALDPDPKTDNGPTLRRVLNAATSGTRVRIVSATGQGNTFFVRSLLKAPQWASLVLVNKTDVELDGNGSTLVFSDEVARYLLVDKCQRVAVKNLSFDLDQNYARVGMYAKLLDVDPQTRTVKAQLVKGDGSPEPTFPRRAKWWRWRPHDPQTLRIGKTGPHFNNGSYATPPTPDPASGPGVFYFTLKEDAKNKLWSDLKAYQGGANFFLINNADFSSNAVSLDNSSHVTFDHVNYYATLGMVFLSSSLDHLLVQNCVIGLPPGETAADRPLSSGADGYHFHLTRGHIIFQNNEIALTDDDPISLKDSIATDIKKVGDNQLEAGKGFKVGQPVELLNPDYSLTGFTANVTAINGAVLTLDKAVPAEVDKGSFLMNRSHHTRDWIIRDNYFHDYYGRVMLYTDFGTVTGNRVHNSYFHLGNSTAYYEKAGASRNVIVHDNLFASTNADSSQWGGNQTLPAFHDITYSNNSFVGKGLKLNNAANSLVAGNLFVGEDAKLVVNRCFDTQVQNNFGFQPDFAVQEKESRGVISKGNEVLRTP